MKSKKTTIPHSEGSITVVTQDPDRLKAITAIAQSNLELAKALSNPVHCTILGCTVMNARGNGISIQTNE